MAADTTHDRDGKAPADPIHVDRHDKGVYKAWCPRVPGISVYGPTGAEAKARLRELIRVSAALDAEAAGDSRQSLPDGGGREP